MQRRAVGYSITLREAGPVHDPAFVAGGDEARKYVLGLILVYGLQAKDRELAEGLDKDGLPLAPISAQTRKHRDSAMGAASKDAPPLDPAYAVSRTRLLLEGEIRRDGVWFTWGYDSHTHGSWTVILDYQRQGIGKRHVKRDVIGLSPESRAWVREKVLTRWKEYVAHGMRTPNRKPAPGPTVPPPRLAVVGRTDVHRFTFGVGGRPGDGADEARKALEAGRSTGFFQRARGTGLTAFGGPNPRRPGGQNPPPSTPPRVSPRPPAPQPPGRPRVTLPTPGPKAAPLTGEHLQRLLGVEKPKPPTPAPRPAPGPPRPAGKPVGDALHVRAAGDTGDAVRTAVNAIARVHGDGDLKRIPVLASDSTAQNGAFAFSRRTGEALDIVVSSKGKNQALTAAHETGHFLEGTAIPGFNPGKRDFGADPLFKEWLDAVKGSKAHGILEDARAPGRKYIDYLLQGDEIWARSYAQYIATRSRDPRLLGELDAVRKADYTAPRHWADDDFAPIASAIDKMFRKIGWIQ